MVFAVDVIPKDNREKTYGRLLEFVRAAIEARLYRGKHKIAKEVHVSMLEILQAGSVGQDPGATLLQVCETMGWAKREVEMIARITRPQALLESATAHSDLRPRLRKEIFRLRAEQKECAPHRREAAAHVMKEVLYSLEHLARQADPDELDHGRAEVLGRLKHEKRNLQEQVARISETRLAEEVASLRIVVEEFCVSAEAANLEYLPQIPAKEKGKEYVIAYRPRNADRDVEALSRGALPSKHFSVRSPKDDLTINVCTIPYSQNPYFFGRELQIEDLTKESRPSFRVRCPPGHRGPGEDATGDRVRLAE
jgi:hypothetical protein